MTCEECLVLDGKYIKDLDMVLCTSCSRLMSIPKKVPKFHTPKDKKRTRQRYKKELRVEH